MELTDPPPPPEIWAGPPRAAQVLVVALQQRIRELEAQPGQNSSNSSRPPRLDPLQAPAPPKAPSTSRKRGGQGEPLGRWGLAEIERPLTVVATCRQPGRRLLDFLVAAAGAAVQGAAVPSMLPT